MDHERDGQVDTVVRSSNGGAWQSMESAPKYGTFVLLYCAEDNSRWLASWQGDRWYGVDDLGLTRQGQTQGDPNYVTSWFVTAWMPLPAPPVSPPLEAH